MGGKASPGTGLAVGEPVGEADLVLFGIRFELARGTWSLTSLPGMNERLGVPDALLTFDCYLTSAYVREPGARTPMRAFLVIVSGLSVIAGSFAEVAGSDRLAERAKQSTLRGVVVDDGTGHGIPGAEVRVVREGPGSTGTVLQAMSGASGTFIFANLDSGSYSIAARRIGYRLVAARFLVDGRSDVAIRLEMTPGPVALDTVTITGEALMPSRYRAFSRMREFYERRAKGVGQFVTRDSIEQMTTSSLIDILRRTRGLRLSVNSDGTADVHSARCQGISVRPQGEAKLVGTALVVNGVRIDPISARYLLMEISSADLEGVEVYRGPAELPAEVVGSACAAIYVWTR